MFAMRLPTFAALSLCAFAWATVPSARAADVADGLVASAPGSPPPYCKFAGHWTMGSLRTEKDRLEFARVSDADVKASLESQTNELALKIELSRGGWHLHGRTHLAKEDSLRITKPKWLSEYLGLASGTEVLVHAARPGEVLIGPPRLAFGKAEEFTYLVPIERWVPCAELGFAFTFRVENAAQIQRVELGLPKNPPQRFLRRPVSVDVAAQPGGPPFLHIGAREFVQEARLLETRGPFSRIAFEHWTGVILMGWLPTASLSRTAGEDDMLGGLSGISGKGSGRKFVVCTASEPLTLTLVKTADAAGPAIEKIGWVEAGTSFIRQQTLVDGSFLVEPLEGADLMIGGKVSWRSRTESPQSLSCH